MKNYSYKLVLCLLLSLMNLSLIAQVQVNQSSNVGVKTQPFENVNENDYPELSLLGRMDMRYPSLYSANVVIGTRAGRSLVNSSSGNVLLGTEAGNVLTSGGGNILLGRFSGGRMTNGGSNVVVGAFSGTNLISGIQNTFLGTFTGNNFTKVGAVTPRYNVVIGHGSATPPNGFDFECSGDNNVLIGRDVAKRISGNANGNVGIGTFTLNSLNGGNDNLAFGYQALGHVEGGSSNVAIGAYAGDYNTGNRNVFIGNRAGPGTSSNPTNVNDRLYIHSASVPTTTPLIYGEFVNHLVQINGNLDVTGTITAPVKNFTIDHPLDPKNKQLVFASIEAPEMINMFRGNVVTDEKGFARVSLPDYFAASNTELSYHLTCIGVFAQAIISQEVENNQFIIQTDQPNVKVSWQVLAKRADQWAKENPLIVEQDKK